MKTMTCKQLGEVCDEKFTAETFDEIAELSKQHGTEMFMQGDEDHVKVITEMMGMMSDPDAMAAWISEKKAEFDALPED